MLAHPALSHHCGIMTSLMKVYAELVVEAIAEIEQENAAAASRTSKAQKNANPGDHDHEKITPSEDDHAEYMGWIIDDFPNSAKQVHLLLA